MPELTKPTCWLMLSICLLFQLHLSAQNGFQSKELKLKTTNSITIDTTINLVLFKADSNFRKGTLVVVPNKNKVFGFKQEPVFPDTIKYKIGDLKDSANLFPFRISTARDSADDRIVGFDAYVLDSNGAKKSLKTGSVTIYIKPVGQMIASNDEFESWFFTGTNFDLFNGVKPQEFYFRSNNILHINKNAYLQFAFYKNRYFVNDSTSKRFAWQNNTPILIRDTMYVYTKGYYFYRTKQTIDPIGLQLDFLQKLGISRHTQNSTTSFFLTGGIDVNSTTVTIENSFSNYDTIMFRTKNPDSTIKGQLFPFPSEKIQYRTGVGNINLGFMCIYDDSKSNFKGQINAGLSTFNQLVILETKGGTPVYKSKREAYFQLRATYTYKPLGISLGLDGSKISSQLLRVNATLAKVFDIESLFKTFSPVNSLSIK